MNVEARSIAVVLLLGAAGAVYSDEPQAPVSAVQQRLNTIEKMKVTEQKLPAAEAAPVSAAVRKALADAAAAERDASTTRR